MRRDPTVLVTGFTPFPGAPANPSQTLIEMLRGQAPAWLPGCDLRLELLRTEYAFVRDALAASLRAHSPDIVILFGLSVRARGFQLERVARNRVDRTRPDAAGFRPERETIAADGPETRESTLPIAAISRALESENLPVEVSDDAGAYLCNYAFHLCAGEPGAASRMVGFVHVPLLEEQAGQAPAILPGGRPPTFLGRAQLLDGARAILRACAEAWRASRAEASRPQIVDAGAHEGAGLGLHHP